MAIFVLAHLSDPHLGPLPRARLHELAGKRATGFFNWQRKRRLVHREEVLAAVVADLKAQVPDHIAVTGDLLNLSLAGEYAPARAWLEALGPPQDVTFVPGNHDAYVRRVADHPQLHWGLYMRADNAAETPGFPYLRRRGPVALIGLSSAVPSAPFMATGRLGSEQLRRLPAVLDQCREEGLFRVIMVHHPPVSKNRFKRLTDGPAFRAVLAQHGAELVIHGHDHAHSVIWLEGARGRIPAVGVPSASEAPPGKHAPAGYNLYRIDGSPGTWRCELIARGLTRDGGQVVEKNRMQLAGG
jgi:3',5'-cyclic AMP phosphodiesterase CpdA